MKKLWRALESVGHLLGGIGVALMYAGDWMATTGWRKCRRTEYRENDTAGTPGSEAR